MATITCLVDFDNPTLTLLQTAPIVQFVHNTTLLTFNRYIYDASESEERPAPTLIFQTPTREVLTFAPTGYTVTEYIGNRPEQTSESGTGDMVDTTDDTTTGSTDGGTTSGGTEEDDIPLTEADDEETITYWVESYQFQLPRILTERPGTLTMSLCYIWLSTTTGEDGTERVIIDKEWNSLPSTLEVTKTLHTNEVIGRLDPSYVLEYDTTGTIAYLTPDETGGDNS